MAWNGLLWFYWCCSSFCCVDFVILSLLLSVPVIVDVIVNILTAMCSWVPLNRASCDPKQKHQCVPLKALDECDLSAQFAFVL